MNCFGLRFIFVILIVKILSFSTHPQIPSEKLHEIIVNAINTYRDNLACVNPVIGLGYISKDSGLIDVVESILTNTKKHKEYRGKRITWETCNYTKDEGYTIQQNIDSFINKCIQDSYNRNNTNLIWLWNPSIIQIGCAHQENNFLCVVNEAGEKTYTDIHFEQPDNSFDEAKTKKDLSINICGGKRLHNYDKIKSCFLRRRSRMQTIHELNEMRNEIATNQNYTNLEYVEWDYDLEMAAIELSQFDRTETKVGDCFTTKKFGNTTGSIYYDHYLKMTPDLYTNFIPNIFHRLKDSAIAESEDPSHYSKRPYGWMYDAKLRAIGCTLFQLSNVTQVVCLFNRDPERKLNLVKGDRFCPKCKCGNTKYPKLRTSINADIICLAFIDTFFVYCGLILVYANIIGIIIFIRSSRYYEKQRSLFSFDF